MSPLLQAAWMAAGFISSTVTSRCVRPFVLRNPSSRKWLVDPNGVASVLPLKSAGVFSLAVVRTTISSAGPMLSTMPINWNGSPCAMPAAVATEPVARPMSQLPATMAVLISAPLPISVQLIFGPTAASNQPSPLAIIVGLVSVKNPRFTLSGAAARARPASPIAPAPTSAARRVVINAIPSPPYRPAQCTTRRSTSSSSRSMASPATPMIRMPAKT